MDEYMFCPHCGHKVLKSYKYCPHCNNRLHLNGGNQDSYQNWQSMNYYNQHVTQHYLYHYGHKYRVQSRSVTFGQAFTSFWKHYFIFSGYCSRSEFWWWFLFEYLIDIILYLSYRIIVPNDPSIVHLIFNPSATSQVINDLPEDLLFALIMFIWNIVIFLPDISIRIRRLRDVGLSEEWRIALLGIDYFSVIIPIIGYFIMFIARIITIILACKPSVRYKHAQKSQIINTPPL